MGRTPLTLAQMTESLFGVRTRVRTTNPVSGVAGAPVQILPNDPRRLSLVITNLSISTVWVGPRNTVGTDNGFWLDANGGFASLVWERDFELVSSEWWALSVGGGDQLYVMQVIGE